MLHGEIPTSEEAPLSCQKQRGRFCSEASLTIDYAVTWDTLWTSIFNSWAAVAKFNFFMRHKIMWDTYKLYSLLTASL
jgi:hypothetical protein